MLIVTEDLIGAAMVQDRILGAPFAYGTELISHAWASGLSALADQPLAKSGDDGFGQAFAGQGSEFARQALGFGMFDD
jgi:hypothetical protein